MTPGKPAVAEPDQRYWRRRANRRVRKARLTRTLGRYAVVSLSLAITGVAMFQALTYATDVLRDTAGLTVERIEIEGARRAGPEAIRSRLAGYAGRDIIGLDLFEVASTAEDDPWVLEATAKRILPGTLRVTVIEREPRAVAVIDGRSYIVDDSGYVVGPGAMEGLPMLTGLNSEDRDALVALLYRGVRAVERLGGAYEGLIGEIAALDFSHGDRIAVRTLDPGPVILLDPALVERNVSHYLGLRREIARRVGSLDYVDLRWQDRISVMPAASNPPKEDG